jgi:DHA2 family metal-tetracycline-proton antiporter-like MFS transporter
MILGYVPQRPWQLAMANTLSNTLSKEQIGIGMGLFMLVNFVASSISGTFIGKALSSSSSVSLNPLHISADGTKYSNIYVVLSAIVAVIAILYTVILKYIDNKKSL